MNNFAVMERLSQRNAVLNVQASEFKTLAYEMVDQIAAFMEELPNKKVTSGENPNAIKAILGERNLPTSGEAPNEIIGEATNLLFNHSLFNGHPRFWGYITSSAAPLGALADLLVASVNANVGAFALSPMATEIEKQTIQWIAELIGYQKNCGGIFVSGGNMANFTGFLAARKHKISTDIRREGIVFEKGEEAKQYTIYCAKGTHTWIEKAAELFGHGTNAIRWINTNRKQQLDTLALENQIEKDKQEGHIPFIVIGNAGSVSTGIIDELDKISVICKIHNLWFHVDGAYGMPAAALPENINLFKGYKEADSIALDPHKWLYSPIEAGCVLVKNPQYLTEAFSFKPEYYKFDGEQMDGDTPVNFHEYGMQNSRGFRALKVWMMLKQAGKEGYIDMIREDISLSKKLFELIDVTSNLEACTQNLSIATFRYVPEEYSTDNEYLNRLNEKLLEHLQQDGEVFLSNAIIDGNYCLRMCIVNFRTSYTDLIALINIVLKEGKKLHGNMQLQLGINA
ncbi:pyridoxal phosphate-dependent decarboxylase family protein [Chondrinema litorale]|uniref:pyridoxal phosphate-dependent decarboxylase family protein n=1 Tax=Chondrinema litorale TaxID=2994555 RepID=UPI002543C9DC|nr:aminotransferase class V-fold PLP-dependent enzyme [Chondrinema litorale]UZR97967.1 aminotransferase class V-fold PLP-dependent enzyme [Chondrinema litorale]